MTQAILGLRANWQQFALLAAVNVFVGGMAGLERTILPLMAEAEFGIASKTAALSFIITFGLAKAASNLLAGNLSQRLTRRKVLILGWLFGISVPFLLIWAPTWGWVIGANVLLGINQGLAWSMTVNMKIDLVGPRRRGVALGINESAGYLSLAAAAYLTGVIAEQLGLRPEPFYLGIGLVALGLALSLFFVRDTAPFVALEAAGGQASNRRTPSLRRSFADATWRKPSLFGITQAGLAWGIFPLLFASRGLGLDHIAILAALYPLSWGVLQLGAGWASDIVGRKPLIVLGMLIQGGAIALIGVLSSFGGSIAALLLLGAGTALVYPTLQAAIGDAVPPEERSTTLGVFRFWRDCGAALGALIAGIFSDLMGFGVAIQVVASLTVASGIMAAATMRRTAARR